MSFGRAKWFFTNYDIITLLTNSNTYTHTNTSEQITYQILVKDLKTSAIRSSCRSVYHFQFPPVFSMLLIYSALSEKRWPENRMLLNKCMIMYRTLLPSPVLSTTGFCFGFGSSPSFFLELFLHWSPVAYWALPTWGVHLSVSYLFASSYCSWGSQGKNTEVVCHSLLQWTTFCHEKIPHIQGQ